MHGEGDRLEGAKPLITMNTAATSENTAFRASGRNRVSSQKWRLLSHCRRKRKGFVGLGMQELGWRKEELNWTRYGRSRAGRMERGLGTPSAPGCLPRKPALLRQVSGLVGTRPGGSLRDDTGVQTSGFEHSEEQEPFGTHSLGQERQWSFDL